MLHASPRAGRFDLRPCVILYMIVGSSGRISPRMPPFMVVLAAPRGSKLPTRGTTEAAVIATVRRGRPSARSSIFIFGSMATKRWAHTLARAVAMLLYIGTLINALGHTWTRTAAVFSAAAANLYHKAILRS